MSLLDNNSRFSGFRSGIRTLRFSVGEPECLVSWAPEDSASESEQSFPEPSLQTSVCGIGKRERDHLVVIGNQQRRANCVTLHIVPFENTEELSRDWDRNVLNWGGDLLAEIEKQAVDDEGKRTLQFMRNVYERFEQRIPTAFLSVIEPDLELGRRREEWGGECQLPRPIFDALAADIRHGLCDGFQLSIELAPTLLDDLFAPPSIGVNVGLLEMGEHSGVFCYGWLKGISWHPKVQGPVFSGSKERTNELKE